ncbi:MAG: efflux RND transporter permease subunit [Ignavibacteria bacterium]|nr:efflux RND transporter permease subunit [Ignavibacteria bacterium]
MQIAKISIERPIMMTMIIMVFVIFGIIGYTSLKVDQMPEIEIPFVTINTIYVGAGPKEIETLITKRIEDAVSTITQIEMIQSYSLDGVSVVLIEFKMGKDIDVANQEVKDKIDAILNDLPEDAKRPIVRKVDIRSFPIVNLVLSGDLNPQELYNIADKNLKDRFSQVDGVASVNISGGQEREIWAVLDDKVAYENSISLVQLLQILKANNMNIPGGYFQFGDQEFSVRLQGEFNDIEAMKEMQIPTPFGPKKLKQFATVIDTGKRVRERAIYFDNITKVRDSNIVRLGIVKSPDGNVIKVADAIREILPEVKASLPPGVNLNIVSDNSEYVKSSIDDTISNIVLGVIFTSIVLFIFLANFRSTFIIALSMPTSIISTFMLLNFFGLTLNMMTLMGISVSIGVLVANSVVVLENIFRHKNLGKTNKQAALVGTSEVTVAVMASTLTNLVVFLPISSMSSTVGQFLKELALAATFATIFSLIFSFTLTPMLAALILPKSSKEGKLAEAVKRFFAKWDDAYRYVLKIILKNKGIASLVALSSFVLLVLIVLVFGSKVGAEFIPEMDDGKIRVDIELPEGYNLEATANVLLEVESIINQDSLVEHTITSLGKIDQLTTGTNMARVEIQLVDLKLREKKVQQVISELTRKLAHIPARLIVDKLSSMGPGGAPIEFYLLGQDVDKLEELKVQVMEEFVTVPGLINFDQSSRPGQPEITVFPDRDKLSEASVTLQEVALTLRSSIEGLESSKYRDLGDEYNIMVTLDNESINSPEKIKNIPVVSQTGAIFRLSELADVRFTTGYSKIMHRDKYTSIQFTGSSAEGVPIANVTNEIGRRMESISLPPGYSFKWGGSTKIMNQMFADMIFAFAIAVLLTYMLMAAMLESFIQPLYILVTIPLAMIGVIIAMYYTNTSFGISSLMGVIMLIGIVVNNAILMLDYTNQLRRDEGMLPKDALINACPVKLKPVLMSTLALILGMLPMALGIGDAGSEMRTPLGIVSAAGLIASTILTLFVVPAFYYIFARSKRKEIV